MAVVGMPHEFAGLSAEEVTIAEVLSEAGYATAHFGKGHLGDIEESYLHNQGFDEALFTPMNQIPSLYNPQGEAVNAILGLHPELYRPIPTGWMTVGLTPAGWVMNIEGKKGELGKEFCGTSNECYDEMDNESEKRTLAFIRKNAEGRQTLLCRILAQLAKFPGAGDTQENTEWWQNTRLLCTPGCFRWAGNGAAQGTGDRRKYDLRRDGGQWPHVTQPTARLGHDRNHVPWW